jgi:hypothetical protein
MIVMDDKSMQYPCQTNNFAHIIIKLRGGDKIDVLPSKAKKGYNSPGFEIPARVLHKRL